MYRTEKTVAMSQQEFDALLTYNCSIPTGTTIGKTWKRNNHYYHPEAPDVWYMGEYAVHPDPEKVRIEWRRILVLDDANLERLQERD